MGKSVALRTLVSDTDSTLGHRHSEAEGGVSKEDTGMCGITRSLWVEPSLTKNLQRAEKTSWYSVTKI